MKNIPRTFLLLAGLFLALMPANQALGQTQDSSSQADALSLWQARHAVTNASKYITVEPLSEKTDYSIHPGSIKITAVGMEFDADYRKGRKGETKHFLIDLKDIKRVTAKCPTGYSECWLTIESGKDYMIQDADAVPFKLLFGFSQGESACAGAENNAECMHSADWFAAALNGLHASAISHPAGLGDFHQQAAAWRALTTKPALAENARILRLAAEDAIKRQKPDEALNDFELGVQADPTWAQGWFNAALLAGELGFFADAADHMQNYLELLPNAPDAQSARDQIDLWKYKAGQSPLTAQPIGVPGKK
jgi:tetratricopeptide (TPR) repeat protein